MATSHELVEGIRRMVAEVRRLRATVTTHRIALKQARDTLLRLKQEYDLTDEELRQIDRACYSIDRELSK